MISLTHINEEELRRFYFLEGKISGRDKEINMLNGVQQEYVASRIHDFIIWNDQSNKSKFEIYIKENLPKMEIKYDTIKKEQEQEVIKKKQENDMKKQIIHDLFLEPNENVRKIVLQRFYISENDYYNERERDRKRNLVFVQEQQLQQREIEGKKANEICDKFNRKYKLNNLYI
jgi:hypothetical protein